MLGYPTHDVRRRRTVDDEQDRRRDDAEHRDTAQVKVKPPRYVVRQMVEEMTGLNFWWVEDLDIYVGNDFVADLNPWDVGPQTRALADLCLVLFNSNEFVYIY